MKTCITTLSTMARPKSAIAMLLVVGGLAAALPAQADTDPADNAIDTSHKTIIPCIKAKTRGLAPCIKNRNAPVATPAAGPGAIAPCVKNKIGGLAPCVKTKAAVTVPVSP